MTINYPSVSEREFLKKYLEFSNLLLTDEQRLAPAEMQLMIEFALLPDKFKYHRFSSLAKDKVIESVTELYGKTLTKLTINNKLYTLLDKQFLRRDIDKVIYMPKHFLAALDAFRQQQAFSVTVNFKREDKEENRPSPS